MRKPKFYYFDKEKCIELVSKCKNRREFYIKYPAAWDAAKKNEWLDDIIPLTKKPSGYWSYDTCKEESLKYKTIKEMKEKCESAYKVILKNKWNNELFKHMNIIGNQKNRLIYAQEFPDFSVYVGLTCNIENRIKNHITLKKETVFKYIKKTGLKPYLKILTEYLPLCDAIKNESMWVDFYKKNGWNVLNKSKTGGIGKQNIKWTKEKILTESLKYNNKKEFKKNNYNAYCMMYKFKIQNEICQHMYSSYKSVSQFTLDGKIIQDFKTTGDASKKTGISQSNISSCCNGKYKSAGGFIWKYQI